MVDYEEALGALSRIEESFTKVEEGESEPRLLDGKKPPIRVRRPPQFVYVNLPDSEKLDAARAALRDAGEWIDGALASIPVEQHASLHAGCRKVLAEVRRLMADHEARVLNGIETRDDIDELRRLVEGELPRRMFDLRDCIERLNRVRGEPPKAAPQEPGTGAARPSGEPPAGSPAPGDGSPDGARARSRASEAEPPKRAEDLRPHDMLTAAEIGELFGVPRTTLQYWQESKSLEYSKHPATGRNLYRWSAIKPFVEGRRGEGR